MPLAYPDGCAAYGLSSRRCAYIAAWAATQAGLRLDQVKIELLGDPDCEGQLSCSVTRSTAFVVRIRVVSPTGRSSDHPVFCGVGGESSLLCTETPTISLSLPGTAGYHDLPCGGEPGKEICASPVPTIDPVEAAAGVPLEVSSVAVPIDHVGGYAIDLGDAVLPNGILSVASATLANDRRTDVVIPQGVRLEVIGDDGRSLANVYEQGWRPGNERVHVRFVFNVEEFEPEARLEFTSIVVR